MMSYSEKIKICGYIKESINEGQGLRTVLFFSGCPFTCKGCHNPESQRYDYGKDFTRERQDKIISDIKGNDLLSGVTLCGGEPFSDRNFEGVCRFVERVRAETDIDNFWGYSGYTFEQLLVMPQVKLLMKTDVLIDGKFEQDKKDLTLGFRGSSNQRIIDVQQSLKKGKVVLHSVEGFSEKKQL